ncbi:unnamed protein product [Closterium sp. NIES-64]|nr:unnamed protein product [Closterium sp. NIES-64]
MTQLDAVVASGSGPQYSKPNAKTLHALRLETFRAAEELALNLSVDMTRPQNGVEADGAELGKVQKVSMVVNADDEGAKDTAAKGAPLDETGCEGEESSEEEAEAHVVAAAAASRPTTSGKRIKHFAQHLVPGAGSAGPSGEVGGKSPVRVARDYNSMSVLPSHKLAAEITQLDCKLATQAEEIARLKKCPESGVGGVVVVGHEELVSALANAVRALEKEARAIALERAVLGDTHNQEALVLGQVDARLGQLQGVVADSMETA